MPEQGRPLVISITLQTPRKVTVSLEDGDYEDEIVQLVHKRYPCGLLDTYAVMKSGDNVAPYQIISKISHRDFEYLRGFYYEVL